MEVKISIVILNYNTANDTIKCVQSLMANKYPKFEVILRCGTRVEVQARKKGG